MRGDIELAAIWPQQRALNNMPERLSPPPSSPRNSSVCCGYAVKSAAVLVTVLCVLATLCQVSEWQVLVLIREGVSSKLSPPLSSQTRSTLVSMHTALIQGGLGNGMPSRIWLEKSTEDLLSLLSSNFTVRDRLEQLWIHPKIFQEWNPELALPCFPLEEDWDRGWVQRSPSHEGLLFVKPPKAGSTTASSVTLRIASRIGNQETRNRKRPWHHQISIPLCKNRVQHSRTWEMEYDQRDRSKSFLWSIVRDPTTRAVSQFFHFHVSRRHKNATDEEFRTFLEEREEMLRSFQLKYLVLKPRYTDDKTNPIMAINKIFRDYDFVGVTERMDESVVAIQMLLNLTASDVAYFSAKSSGGYDDGRYHDECTFIQKSFVSPAMKEYFAGVYWQNLTYWDRILHEAANVALDMTIRSLGKSRFQQRLTEFKRMKVRLAEECADEVILPCTANGTRLYGDETSCIYDDMGCGFSCIDRVCREMGIS